MPDPIRKRFGYGQLWPLRPAGSQNRPGSYICRIRLLACDRDGLVRVWPKHLVWKEAAIAHSVLHVRCVSCLCPKTVSISWYCMFHNGCISCCVFGHFTAAPRHGIGAGRSGKKQFICRLETGLHFFLGNTKLVTTQVYMFVEKLNH